MSTALLILALWVTVPLAVLVVGAWWIEHRDAEQGPPPTLRPDVRAACEDTWAAEVYAREWDRQAAWDADVERALRIAGDPTPIHDELACEHIARMEGWA